MTDFFLNIPARVHFGVDVINQVGSCVQELGDRVLLVTEAILYEHETINRIQRIFDQRGINYITYDEIVPNATSTCAEEALRLARVSRVNTVVGLGGNRVLSLAKFVAMLAGGQGNVDACLSGARVNGEPLPYVEIPTTCRYPFLLTDQFLVTDARTRKGFLGTAQPGITRYILADPQLCTSLPWKYLTTILLDILLLGIEGYISKRSNFLSDSFFLKAIELCVPLLENREPPEELLPFLIQASTAGFLTSLGHTMCPPGLGACIGFALNSRLLVPKSWGATIFLPHILEFNLATRPEKMLLLAGLLGEDTREDSPEEGAQKAVRAVRRIIGSRSVPVRLGEFDIKPDELVTVAENVHSFDFIRYIPRGAGMEDIYSLLKGAI